VTVTGTNLFGVYVAPISVIRALAFAAR